MRRIFYDVQSPKLRAELLLFASDVMMLAAPTFLVTSILERQAVFAEFGFLIVWIAIPRAVARNLSGMVQPRDPVKLYAASLGFVVLTAALLAIGWHLLSSEDEVAHKITDRSALLVVITWCCGFLLFDVRAYRIYEFLCGAIILTGLLDARPAIWLWIPLFFVGFFFSTVTRHTLLDVVPRTLQTRVNLQNARVLALGATLFASSIFFLFHAIFGAPVEGLDSSSSRRALSGLRSFGESDSLEHARGENSKFGETTAPGESPQSMRFSYKIPLNSLGTRADDLRVAWQVRIRHQVSSSEWPPSPNTYWRAATLSTFDPRSDSWAETAALDKREWPNSGRVQLRSRASSQSSPTELVCEVKIPVFKSLVRPAGTMAYSSGIPESYRLSPGMDVFPSPTIDRDFRYALLVVPIENMRPPPVDPGLLNGLYTRIPAASLTGVEIEALGAEIFAGQDTLEEKLAALSDYFRREGFLYSRGRFARGNRRTLEEFATHSRTGNCTHYATLSALLLRTQKIATRFTVGFLGWEPGEDADSLRLMLRSAHAWAEYHLDGRWVPYDATGVVEPRSPEDIPPRLGSSLSSAKETGTGEDWSTDNNGYEDRPRSDGDFRNARRDPRESTERTGKYPESRRLPGKRNRSIRKNPEEYLGGSQSDLEWFSFGEGFEGGALGEMHSGIPVSEGEKSAESARGKSRESETGQERVRKALRRVGPALRVLLVAIGLGLALFLWRSSRLSNEKKEDDADKPEEDEDDASSVLRLLNDKLVFDSDDPRGRVITAYHELQNDLGRTRLQRLPHQTPLEHALRTRSRFPSLKRPLEIVTGVLYGVLFSSGKTSEGQAEEYERQCRIVRRKLR